jgi:hypothetical protein
LIAERAERRWKIDDSPRLSLHDGLPTIHPRPSTCARSVFEDFLQVRNGAVHILDTSPTRGRTSQLLNSPFTRSRSPASPASRCSTSNAPGSTKTNTANFSRAHFFRADDASTRHNLLYATRLTRQAFGDVRAVCPSSLPVEHRLVLRASGTTPRIPARSASIPTACWAAAEGRDPLPRLRFGNSEALLDLRKA